MRVERETYVGSVLKFSGDQEAVSVLHASSNRALRHSGRSVLPLRSVLEQPVPVKSDGLRQAVLDVDDDRVTFETRRSMSTREGRKGRRGAASPLLTSMSGPGYWPFTTSLWSESGEHEFM